MYFFHFYVQSEEIWWTVIKQIISNYNVYYDIED